MLRGFYNAAAGMIAQQRRQEMLSNNIANANTPGYKADQGVLRTFPSLLLKEMDGTSSPHHTVGGLAVGMYMQETVPNFGQGDMQETGVGTDLALWQEAVPNDAQTGKPGALFYEVRTREGDVRYTRNGHFSVDPENKIVTAERDYLLDTNGQPITVNDENFSVSGDGTITDQGRPAGKISVALISNPMNLMKEGGGLYRLQQGQQAGTVQNASFQVKQGFIERSNVDAQQSVSEMMQAYRSFEANQKVLQAYDRSMEKAVNEVGRIG